MHVLVTTARDRTLTTRTEVQEDVAWLVHHAARYLLIRWEITTAQPLFERARRLQCSILGDDHPETQRVPEELEQYKSREH